jgi:hypothetical protein
MKERPPKKDSPEKDRPPPSRRRRGAISEQGGQGGTAQAIALAVALSQLEDAQNDQPASESAVESDSTAGPSTSAIPSSTDSISPQRAPQGTRRTGRQLNLPIRPARQARQVRAPRLRTHAVSDSTSSLRLDRDGNNESHSPRGPSTGDPSTSHESRNNENDSIRTRARQYSRSPKKTDKTQKEQGPDFRGNRQ